MKRSFLRAVSKIARPNLVGTRPRYAPRAKFASMACESGKPNLPTVMFNIRRQYAGSMRPATQQPAAIY
jgi:hypothetical protein